jgi:hypothetical protein
MVVMSSKRVAVTPVYGWGWSDSNDADLVLTPQAFTAEVEQDKQLWSGQSVKTLRGNVVEPAHELDGFSILISPRHNPWDGVVNVELKSIDGRQLNGFASIDIASFE